MKRERMFPTKSRVQVAIALEKLLWAAQEWTDKHQHEEALNPKYAGAVYDQISVLCFSRLALLLKPCLYPPAASFYDHHQIKEFSGVKTSLANVHRWRRRYPELLTKKGD